MANVIEHRNELLGDAYYEVRHETGLTILVYPKAGYSTSYAVIGTNYGSIDDALKVRGGEEKVLPWGTAHFLEHKLFESEELDAFERFAETGASANAYTTFDRTCYLFSCSSNFRKRPGAVFCRSIAGRSKSNVSSRTNSSRKSGKGWRKYQKNDL
ncbi:MAG: insulinase family protein, partial [Clostridia bacterium]|nr:insulinase family protein [Clostridia bacterium]